MSVFSRPWIRRSLAGIALLLLLVAAGSVWLLYTQSGANRLVALALSRAGAGVTVENVSGTVARGLTLSGLRYGADFGSLYCDTVSVAIDLSDLPGRTLTIEYLDLQNITIDIRSGGDTGPAVSDTPATLPRIDLPVDIVLQKLTVTNVVATSDATEPVPVIDHLFARLMWIDTMLTLDELTVRSVTADLTARGSIQTAGDYATELDLDSTLRLPEYAEITSSTQLGGDLKTLEINHRSDSPYDVELKGVVSELLSQPEATMRAMLGNTRLANINTAFPDVELSGEVNAEGDFGRLFSNGSIRASIPAVGTSDMTFETVVTPDQITIGNLAVRMSDVEGTPQLRARGDIQIAGEEPALEIALDWDRLRWPLREAPVLTSTSGQGTVKGTLSDYRIELEGQAAARYEPNGSFNVALAGGRQALTIKELRVRGLEGSVSGQGQVAFGDQPGFTGSLKGTGLNPQGLDQEWPGKIDFNVSGSGSLGSNGLGVKVDRLEGGGQLRGYPVSFDGRGRVTPEQAVFDRFNLRTGDTEVVIAGTLAQTLDLDWKVSSPNLNAVWPGLTGELSGSGKARGNPDTPKLSASINGRNISFRDASVEDVEADLGVGDDATGTASIQARNFAVGGYRADNLTVAATGSVSGHEIEVTLDDIIGKSLMALQGSLSDTDTYTFTLNALELNPPEFGVWALTQPSTGTVSAGSVSLSPSCLIRESSNLCVSIDSSSEQLTTVLSITDVPLSIFSHALPPSVRARGDVNGGGKINIAADGSASGNMRFDFDPMTVESRITKDTQDSTLAFLPSSVTGGVDESGRLTVSGDFPLQSGGGLNFSGTMLSGGQKLLDRDVSGEFSVVIPSLAFLPDYIPDLSQSQGQIRGDIDLSGSVRRPQLVGTFALENGSLTLEAPGVEARDVFVTLAGKQDNRFTLSGRATSGGGELQLDGELALSRDGNQGRLKVSGSDFQVLNTREAQVFATPDVTLVLDEELLELSGSVAIPRARIDIDELPKGTIQVSKDEVIVGQKPQSERVLMPINSKLQLDIGEDVQLSAFGLDAQLGGAITITEKSGKAPTATGEIELIDGEYQAYGQQLTITRGRLVYAGGPLDSPGIDLRAVRTPAAGIEVGITARGVISQPTFSVFSSPSMSESDQLAYLIFGRPINDEASSESTLITRAALTLGMQGGEALTQRLADDLGVDQLGIESQGSGDISQASLVIGKYLSPKLFVSYGIGLLEPVSTLKLEYALSSRWQLVTESSPSSTGADVQFTYER